MDVVTGEREAAPADARRMAFAASALRVAASVAGGAHTASAIARRTGLTRQQVYQILRNLQAVGLVGLEDVPPDPRRFVLLQREMTWSETILLPPGRVTVEVRLRCGS